MLNRNQFRSRASIGTTPIMAPQLTTQIHHAMSWSMTVLKSRHEGYPITVDVDAPIWIENPSEEHKSRRGQRKRTKTRKIKNKEGLNWTFGSVFWSNVTMISARSYLPLLDKRGIGGCLARRIDRKSHTRV